MLKTEVYLMDVRLLKEDDIFSAYLGQVAGDRQIKINALKSSQAKARSLGAGLLLGQVLKKHQIDDQALITYNKNGKPFLKDYGNFHFNLSHSGDFVVCAAGPQEVGVDIQKIKDLDLKLAKRFFHKKEFEFLANLPSEMKKIAFNQIWAGKESYLKYLGTGLATPLNSFELQIDQDHGQVQGDKGCLRKYQGPEGYVIWSCSDNDNFDRVLKTIALKRSQ